jgi:pilus assembly protein Flp/PilA
MSKMRENIVDRIVQYVKQFLSEEDGVTAIEYGLIAALIAVMIIGGVSLAGTNLQGVFNFVAGKLTTGS